MLKSRVKISVFGKVQDVNFRTETLRFAEEHGIYGWVKNTPEGTLVINAEGNKPEIKKLIEWCQSGPKNAKVEKCEAYYQKYKGEFSEFEIKYEK